MVYFRRALFLTLWGIVLVLTLVLGFETVNFFAAKSGFSSGEVFLFEHEEGFLSGEIFGESFFADLSFAKKALPILRAAAILLPPPVKFIIRLCFFFL